MDNLNDYLTPLGATGAVTAAAVVGYVTNALKQWVPRGHEWYRAWALTSALLVGVGCAWLMLPDAPASVIVSAGVALAVSARGGHEGIKAARASKKKRAAAESASAAHNHPYPYTIGQGLQADTSAVVYVMPTGQPPDAPPTDVTGIPQRQAPPEGPTP